MMYNPYDLISMSINGTAIDGRPIAFDSDIVNANSLTNASGNLVKPTRVSTVCPDCGQGLEFEVNLDDPPFRTIERNCHYCHPEPSPQTDPFMNPIKDGRVSSNELDPLLHDPTTSLASRDTSVAERLQVESQEDAERSDGGLLTSEGSDVDDEAARPKKAKKKPKKAKKPPKPSKKVELEPAQGMGGEEVEFDDDDLIETE